jgi:N-acetylglutamate synthase-like GNAT family acetyltransferase
MKIEKAVIKDAEEILNLQKKAFKQEAELYNDFNIEPLTVTLEQTKEEFKKAIVLKLTENRKIIGSVRADINDGTCLVRKLIVDPAYQNMGYGAALMIAIEKECSGCGRFELFTGSKSENNMHLYKKLGYVITGTKMLNDKVEAVNMVKARGAK